MIFQCIIFVGDVSVHYREQVLDQCVSCLTSSTRSVQVAIVAALRCYVDRLTLLDGSIMFEERDNKVLNRILAKIYQALESAFGKC
jgi:hypothetical protein